MARRRSPFATFLATLGALALVAGIVAFWASRTVGDDGAFSSLAGDLLRQDAVRSRLATAVVDPVLAASPPQVQRQRPVIVATTERVLGDERFVPIFEGVLARAHRDLVDGEGDVRLRLAPALDAVAIEVAKVAPNVATQLAGVTPPEPVVVGAAQADRVRSLLDTAHLIAVAFLLGGAILGAIALFGGGPRALVPFGSTLAAACVLVLLLLYGVRELVGIEVSGGSREAAGSAFGVVIGGLRTTLLVAALVGVAAAIVGAVVSRRT